MARRLKGVSENCLTDSFSYHDEERVERMRERTLSRHDLSDAFRDRVGKFHDRLRTSYAYRQATAASRRLRNVGREDRIEQLLDIGSLQHSRRKMRRAIMASRTVRRARELNLIDGFREEFKWRDTMANDHSELLFRQLNDGVMQTDKGRNFAVTYWLHKEDAKEYSKYDRGEILITQRHVDRLITEGKGDDPTSKYNACLSAFYP